MSRQASADLQRSKSIVRRFDELIRDGDPSDLATLCTLDMVNHALAPSRPQGLDGTREFLIECRRDPRRAEWMRGLVHRDSGGCDLAGRGVPRRRHREWAVQDGRRVHVPAC
jgi:hypothetical protein